MTYQNNHHLITPHAQITRRDLIELAFVASPLLTNMQRERPRPSIVEEFLSEATTSITACWHLLRGDGLTTVECAVPQYLSLLEGLVKHSSLYRRRAAYLAAQSFLLQSLIAYHHLRFAECVTFSQQAVWYAEESGDQLLLLDCTRDLGGSYRCNGEFEESLNAYLQAERYSNSREVPGFLGSHVKSGLGVAYAKQGKSKNARRSLDEAHTIFIKADDQTPVYLEAPRGRHIITHDEGRSNLALGDIELKKKNASGALEYYKAAADKLVEIEQLSPQTIFIPTRFGIQVILDQALAAAKMGNLEDFEKYFIKGANATKEQGNKKREQEAWDNLIFAIQRWPHETRVTNLLGLLR